jgi:hypothetical protein
VRSTPLALCIAIALAPTLLASQRPADALPRLDRSGAPPVVNQPASPPALLLYRADAEAVEGTYRFDGISLELSARRLSDDAAEVRFWTPDGSFELESVVLSRHDGRIRSGSVEVSGRGELGSEARRLIGELVDSRFAEPLVLLPLEMGCRLTAEAAAPLLAAFVQPWQIIYKHTGRLLADVDRLRLRAGCDYSRPAAGRLLVFGEQEAVAHVPSFQILDAAGAAPRAMVAPSTAPCGAKCRGACGADCSSPLCSVKSSGCEFVCPTHSFCRFHDGCYDGCNAAYGCWSPLAWVCKRGCDDQCLASYPSTTCAAWSQGLGPNDGYRTYNECPSGGGGGGGGGDGCLYAEVQVVREPGITPTAMGGRRLIAEPSGDAAAAADASRIQLGPAAGEAARWTPDGPSEWRQHGPDAVFAFTCDGGSGGTHCTDCTCEGEVTSWEGEVCGSSSEELVDECWNSCY